MEGMKKIGGTAEEVVAYFNYNKPKTPHPKVKVLKQGQEFKGTYQGFFKDEKYGKLTHYIETDKGRIGVKGCTQLDRTLEKVADGTRIGLIYNGQVAVKKGPFKGKLAHNFDVFVSALAATTTAPAAEEIEETTEEDSELPF